MKIPTLEQIIRHPQMIEVPGHDIKLWVKPLTQIDRDMCHASARRASREFRKLLEDTSTDQHQLLVADELAEYSKKDLAALWVSSRLVEKAMEVQRQSLEDRDKTYIPEPEGDGVTSAQMDRYENEVEEVEEQREQKVVKVVQIAKEQLEEKANKLTVTQLRKDAMPDLVETILARTWQQEYAAQMIVRGTFKDEKCLKPAFKTIEEVHALQPDILEFLAQSHYGMMVEPEALKA